MSDKMPELLPCPFCGGSARIEIFNYDHWQAGYIQCQHCRNRTQGDGTKAQELAKWNTRATPCAESRPPQPQAVICRTCGGIEQPSCVTIGCPDTPVGDVGAQSVNGQMLEALKGCVNGGAFKHPQIVERAKEVIAAAEKAQKKGE